MAVTAPITPADIQAALKSLEGHDHIALAVSGGADSLALLHLLSAWRKALSDDGPQMTVLTFDHALRAQSAAEAEFVAERAKSYGLPAKTLLWKGAKPASNIQETAREARYQALLTYCLQNRITALLTAHHMDDQAETLLMRLARGSGVDGLSAIPQTSMRSGVTLLRPLIDVPKIALVATLEAAGLDWVEDPSNANEDFERVRVRNLMHQLESLGLTAEKLALTAKRMRRARHALEAETQTFMASAATLHNAGFCQMEFAALSQAPQEIALRALICVLQAVGGNARPPELAKVENLYTGLFERQEKSATLAGCHLDVNAGKLTFVRELRKDAMPELLLQPGEEALWDRRFRVSAARGAGGPVIVRPLTSNGFSDIRKALGGDCLLPPLAGASLVSFWREGEVLSVPHMGYNATTVGNGYFTADFLNIPLLPKAMPNN